MSETVRRARARLAFPLLLLLILCCFYWKLLFTYQFDWVWGVDLTMQILPWFEEQSRQLHSGHFPLWDTHEWGGQPLPGQAQGGTFYPLNWILWLMPHQGAHLPMLLLNFYYVAIHFMAALFAYLLCRDLERSRQASLAAGLIFALAGFLGRNDWPQMINGAVWTPLIFLFLLRAVRAVRPLSSAALCGLFLGMAWLAGHHQIPIYLTIASGLVWIYYSFRSGKLDLRMAGLALLSMTFSVLVGAAQILPAREFGQLALRWVGARNPVGWSDPIPYYIHGSHSLHPFQLFGILIPQAGQSSDPFIGVVAFSLALLGLKLCWEDSPVRLFAALAVGGVLFAIGPHSVFHGLIYAVAPFVEKARVPAMSVFLFQAGAAVLAAYGIDRLHASPRESPWLRSMVRAVFSAGRLLAIVILFVLVSTKFNWDWDDRVVMTALVTLLLAGLLYGWRAGALSPRLGFTLLTMLLLLELGNDAGFSLSDRNEWEQRKYIERVRGNPDVADFFHSEQKNGPFRVETQTEEIHSNWGDYHDVDFVQSYAGVTVNTWKLEMHTWPTRMLYGVRYTLARNPTHEGQREIFHGVSGIKVYENPEAFPRAWAVHELVAISSVDQAREFVAEHTDQLRLKALSAGVVPNLQRCPDSPDQVAVTRYQPSSVAVSANMGCAGIVVLTDTFYPGWRATVDGAPTPIQEVDMALRGVAVGQGQHEIQFYYRPWSVYLGVILSLSGVGGALALVFIDRRRAISSNGHQ